MKTSLNGGLVKHKSGLILNLHEQNIFESFILFGDVFLYISKKNVFSDNISTRQHLFPLPIINAPSYWEWGQIFGVQCCLAEILQNRISYTEVISLTLRYFVLNGEILFVS